MGKKPSVDVKEQAALGAEVPPQRDITHEVFELVKESADVLLERCVRRGALIVIGRFASMGAVKGALARPPNPFEGLYLSAADKAFQKMLLQEDALEDGAVVVDTSGQVLGGRIYFFVENREDLDIPEGGFARHIAAASTSLRKDVEAVITLSEDKNVARIFRDGKVVEAYDPALPVAPETPEKQERPARKGRPVGATPSTGRRGKAKKKSDRKRKTAKAPRKRTAKVAKAPGRKPEEEQEGETAARSATEDAATPEDASEEATE